MIHRTLLTSGNHRSLSLLAHGSFDGHPGPENANDPDPRLCSLVIQRVALVHEAAIACSDITCIYSEGRVLSQFAEAFFQRFKVDVSLQGTELAKGVDVDIVEIAVCRA